MRLAALALPSLLAPALVAQAPLDLDATVAAALKRFNVPGVAIGVIKDGRVVLAKGYGVRDLRTGAPVTSKTLFGIASNTKAFTAAALAMLVEEGKLAWDTRVVDVLPGFQLADPYVTREMRIDDLLVHRSGFALGAGDLMLFPDGDLTDRQLMKRLRHVPLATSFRSTYAYDNVLYSVAGLVIEDVSGKPWSTFIRERIFTPLGMTRSLTNLRDAKPGEDLAAPHALDGSTLRVVVPSRFDTGAAAGSIQSSVDDLLPWIETQLRRGAHPKGRLFSEAQSRRMWTPHVGVPINPEPPKELADLKPHFSAYALGWTTRDYRGRQIVSHTGGLAGMVSEVTLVPEQNLGIVVLTNQEVGAAFRALTTTVLDHYLGAPPRDWVAAFGAVRERQVKEGEAAVAQAAGARKGNAVPSLPLEAYAQRYQDAWYGDIFVTQDRGRLRMRFSHTPLLTGLLEPFQYDTFIVRWDDRSLLADAYVTFTLDAEGRVAGAKMKAVSPLTDFSYDFHHLDLKPVAKDAPPY